MDLKLLIHLIIMIVLNLIFFFSGVVLNTLVIITILKTRQLRKKLCHFMIMVLSCCDLLTILIFNSGLILSLITWAIENYYLLSRMKIYLQFSYITGAFSMCMLMVMCIERYMGVYYPIFHKTSVTRRRLLTLFAIIMILETTLLTISAYDSGIFGTVAFGSSMVIYFTPFIFFNYKLFKISRKMRRENTASHELRRRISLKRINTYLLAVACLMFWSIPISVYVVFTLVEGSMSYNAIISGLWVATTNVMKCSFNSLIFFWKNKLLRDEGIKVIKKIKDFVLRS